MENNHGSNEETSDSPTNRRSKRTKLNVENNPGRSIGKVEVNQDFLDKIVSFAKANRPRALTSFERVDILLLQGYLRHEHEKKQTKVGPGRRIAAPEVSRTIAKMLRRQEELVKNVWSEYINAGTLSTNIVAGNRNAKCSVIPDCRYVTAAVREFVRERRITRTRTVAKDVLLFLASKDFIAVDRSNNASMKAGLRAVQRFLNRKGYKRGKKGRQSYRLKEHVLLMRDKYVSRMSQENALKTRRIVYMDESYIHKNYCRHEDSLFDPNDEQDLTTIVAHKGQRYCFIAAIVDADHAIPEELRNSDEKAGLLMDTLDIFEGGKKQTKDYHGMFDHNYFVNWMKKLLQVLKDRNISNAVIVMDNAKYHKKLPDDVPRMTDKKNDLQEACRKYGMDVSANLTKAMLWEKLHQHIQANISPVIVKMAEDEGHEVLFTPPHFSDLQPIETVWAIVKGIVGRQYTTTTTFKDVLLRLKHAFETLQPHTVQGCIKKANKNLDKLRQSINVEDNVDSAFQESDCSGSSDISDEENSATEDFDLDDGL